MRFFLLIFIFLCSFSHSRQVEDFYGILGLSKNASQEDIRKAYIRLAKENHPDQNPGQDKAERMKKINEAYDTLKDPLKRKRYNEFGSEEWAQAQDSSKGFSGGFGDFSDLWTQKPSSSQSQTVYSEKAFYLFRSLLEKIVILNTVYQGRSLLRLDFIEKIKRQSETNLRALLKDLGFSSISKASRQRILNNLYHESSAQIINNLLKSIKESKNISLSSSLSTFAPGGEMTLYEAFVKFVSHIEERYFIQDITAKERKAVEIFHRFSFFSQSKKDFSDGKKRYEDLLIQKLNGSKLSRGESLELKAFERQNRKDLRLFRKMLSALGLPGAVHNDFLLRSYLDSLKQSLFDSRVSQTKAIGFKPKSDIYGEIYIRDKDIIEALRKVKTHFDNQHYQNLDSMRRAFKAGHLIKSFPGQFTGFAMVVGASIFRQAMTDPLFYGVEKNPGALDHQMEALLTSSGLLSFYIFISVAQKTHYHLYGLGRFMDGKSLKTSWGQKDFNGKWLRAMAPGVSLGAGFFVSSLFDEILQDPHLKDCAKQLYSKNYNHRGPCEKFYIDWVSSDKWKHYMVDIATLISAGSLSHKLLNSALALLRKTAVGSSFLLKAGKFIGLRASGLVGFVFNLYGFMEIHKILDEWIGQPVKEHLTASGVKNHLIELKAYLEKDLYNLSFYSNLSGETQGAHSAFKEKITNAEDKIKAIGYKFKHWIDVRGRHYNQSAQLWIQKINKLFAPYKNSLESLKRIFILSRFNYSLEISSEEKGFPWDSEREINKDTLWGWNQLNKGASFSFSSFYQNKRLLKNGYCHLEEIEDLKLWKSFCEGSSVPAESEMALFYETAYLILNKLEKVSYERELIGESNFMLFVGKSFDEMFSPYSDYSLKKLSYDEKFQLARVLMRVGLNGDQSFFSDSEIYSLRLAHCASFFPQHETERDSKELYNLCLNPDQRLPQQPSSGEVDKAFLNAFEERLKLKISNKLLSAGLYLLKDLMDELKNGYDVSKIWPRQVPADFSPPVITSSSVFESVLPLAQLLEVYKKGEKFFALLLEAQKEKSPYQMIKDLSCGGSQTEDSSLALPLFFEGWSLYNGDSDQWESQTKVCEKFDRSHHFSNRKLDRFHGILFDRPAQSRGKSYENLYLAMEGALKADYSSSQDLARDFKSLSQNQIDSLAEKIASSLESLTNNYYKNLVNKNSSFAPRGSLEAFESYYSAGRILFDIRSFTGGLKGLEISLFQVNYWMNTLKQLLIMGDRGKEEEFKALNHVFSNWNGFSPEAFEKAQKEILQLLQSYHDSYQRERGPYLIFPKQDLLKAINDRFEQNGSALYKKEPKSAEDFSPPVITGSFTEESYPSSFTLLMEEYPDSPLPVFMESDRLLSHILAHSVPVWNNKMKISSLNSNITARFENDWDKLIHTVFYELNQSLRGFFSQMDYLRIKDSFENEMAL